MKNTNGLELYPFELNFDGVSARFPFIFEGKPITSPSCLISSREAGDMVFRLPNKNRDIFLSSMFIPAEKVYSLAQVHSRDVFALNPPVPSPAAFVREGDGMVNFAPDVFLAVTVADCLPVFLLDTESGAFSALHSGWKGTGIVLRALEIMQNAGCRPEAIAAVLGPCIQDCCYNVDEERARNFEAEFGHFCASPAGCAVTRKDGSSWYLKLQEANIRMLAAEGVRHIAYNTDCTFTDERLGSFRREGRPFTHMLAVAGPFG